jgi:hypothetical protein
MLLSLLIVYGYFYATVEELSSLDRDHMAFKAKNIYYLAFYRTSSSTCVLEKKERNKKTWMSFVFCTDCHFPNVP